MTSNAPTCRPHDESIPADVARYHGLDELPAIGATVRWSYLDSTFEGEILGFEREYRTTRVKTLMHATTCPVGCVETSLRTYEGTVVDYPVSVRIVPA